MPRHLRFALALLALLVFFSFAVGCAGDDDDDNDSGSPSDDDDTDTPDDDDAADDDDEVGDRLYAGAASGYLDVPIGISLGGFAARIGFKTAYNRLMGGSRGFLDRPNVKAVALRRGDAYIVFAKASMMGVTESLRTQIVNQVLAQTGVDLDRSLILNANHSHSGPARWMPVPDLMGLVGVDVYSQEIVDRIAGSLTGAIVEAINGLEPARIGFGYREQFDPLDQLTGDRRCYNGPGDFKEDRLWVGQVENDQGDTMAVLVGMAMHGVVFGYGAFDLTGDAPDGVERAIEEGYDYPITAMYLQGSAGDVVPKMWSPQGHRRLQVIESIGARVANVVRQVQRGIVTDDAPELSIITRRYVSDRETLGYLPGEFGHYNMDGEFIEYERGAMECGVLASKAEGSVSDCDAPETTLVDGYLGCLLDLAWPIVGDYADSFLQQPITVAQIGDQYFFTAPGEITSHLAVDIRTSMADALNVPFENVNTIGYAQNYIFYILQDWDWWQGGGETAGSLFGPRYGPWLQKEVNWLAGFLRDGQTPPADDPAPYLYARPTEAVPIEASEQLGVVQIQPEPVVDRFYSVKFAWHGGHAGVDSFTVMLQRNEGGSFVDVLRHNGTPYDEKGWEMIVDLYPEPNYRAEASLAARDFLYKLDWETSYDDPTGELRFKVVGRAKTDAGIVDYEVYSDPFELLPVDNVSVLELDAAALGDVLHIEALAAYPPDPLGARRIRSPLAGGNQPAIVTSGHAVALIEDANGSKANCELVFDAQSARLVGEIDCHDLIAPLAVTIDAEAYDDGFGNTNAEASESVSVTP
jgi:hypothetical protein